MNRSICELLLDFVLCVAQIRHGKSTESVDLSIANRAYLGPYHGAGASTLTVTGFPLSVLCDGAVRKIQRQNCRVFYRPYSVLHVREIYNDKNRQSQKTI